MKKTINGVEYTTFEENKRISELVIDTTRKFIVVHRCQEYCLKEGDIVVLEEDDGSRVPLFRRISDGKTEWLYLGDLSYYDERKFINYDNTIITDIDDVETSHKIQKKLFENGYGIGYDKSKDLENYNFNYIMVDNNKAFWFGYGVPDSYYSKEYKKITAREFLGEEPDPYYVVGIAEKIKELEKESEKYNKLNNTQPETKCSGGKTIMSRILNFAKDMVISKEDKELRKAGLKDENLSWTDEARRLLTDLLLEDNKARLVELAENFNKEEKKKD